MLTQRIGICVALGLFVHPLLAQTPVEVPLQPVPVPPGATTTVAPPPMFPSQPEPTTIVEVPLANTFDWSKFTLGGQYRLNANANNYPFHPLALPPAAPRSAFVIQRFRLWGTYAPNENVEGYLQMQVGGFAWGTNFDFNKNFVGNFTNPNDRVGIELRRAWLALKDPGLGKVRFGILDWHDSFDDTLASSNYDFNVGGADWVVTVPELDNLRFSAAALTLMDRAFTPPTPVAPPAAPGTANTWLFATDIDQPIGDKFSIGSSVYYMYDRGGYAFPTAQQYISAQEWWFGARAKWNNDVMPVNAFFLVNTGTRDNFNADYYRHTGYAGKLEFGALKVGEAKWYTQMLYSTGGAGREFRTVAQSFRDNFGGQGYWSYLQVAAPNGPGDVNDLGISLQNRSLGLMTLQSKIEVPLTKRITGTTAGGYLMSDRANPLNGSKTMGTEVGQMFTYDFGGGLKLDTGCAVLFTGDFYRPAPNADKAATIWEAFSRLQLEF